MEPEHATEIVKMLQALQIVLDEINKRVDIVRCKDCKHYINPRLGWCDINSHMDDLKIDWVMYSENDYCSYGEPKIKEDEKGMIKNG